MPHGIRSHDIISGNLVLDQERWNFRFLVRRSWKAPSHWYQAGMHLVAYDQVACYDSDELQSEKDRILSRAYPHNLAYSRALRSYDDRVRKFPLAHLA